MKEAVVIIVLVLLVLGFLGVTYASSRGAGLIASGSPTTRSVFFVFPGGGPGSGK
jgi:hypothetical protein